jgi:hypothetical protein
MTRGTAIVTVNADMAEDAAKIAGLVGMKKDAMMIGAMTIGVTTTAVMMTGGTKGCWIRGGGLGRGYPYQLRSRSFR